MAFKCSVIVYLCSLLLVTNSQLQLQEGDDCLLASEEPGKCVHLSKCNTAIKAVKNGEHPVKCGFKGLDLVPLVCCSESNKIQARLSEESDDCTVTLDKSPGKCMKLAQCPSAISALQAGTHPQQCASVGIEPTICCATSSGMTLGVSDQNCMSYSAFVPEFPIVGVVGGTSTSAQQFPHMASLGYARGDEKLWRCGGSLISDRFVLTAAHCLQSQEFGYVSWVRLAEQNLPDPGFPDDYQIIERIAHPQYRAPSVYNDVALVKLDRAVGFTVFVKPACLYTNPDIAPNTTLIATGWGLTKYAGNTSEQLQRVDLDIFSGEECNEKYSNMAGTRKLISGISGDTQVCAGGRTIEKDTCQGDSGGPLQVYLNDSQIYSIVGLTSFGKTCGLANIPGVYSRVSYYVPWIESVVWPK